MRSISQTLRDATPGCWWWLQRGRLDGLRIARYWVPAPVQTLSITLSYLVRKPTTVSFEEAAASVLPGVRALNSLFYHAHVRAGDFVLVTNGASVRVSRCCGSLFHLVLIDVLLACSHLLISVCNLPWRGAPRSWPLSQPQRSSTTSRILISLSVGGFDRQLVLISSLAGKIIDLSSENLVEAVMEETGSLGADCIIGTIIDFLKLQLRQLGRL